VFDRFTDRARKVMGLARVEAANLCHDYIGTEHMLLGLLAEGGGVAAVALRNLKVNPGRLRHAVLALIESGTTAVAMGQIPFTPRGKKVLELSMEEATRLMHSYIGTEHLLIGLIAEDHGVAARALKTMGVTVESVRREVNGLLGSDQSETEPTVHVTRIHGWTVGFREEDRIVAALERIAAALERAYPPKPPADPKT
jgi:ATP-dependent Clp protease ATP-binding subunit ClpC